jgi:hypothetical protein
MRDYLADEMAAEIGTGSTQADVGMLVSGLRKLFSILEMMKLVSGGSCWVLYSTFADRKEHRTLRIIN